MDFVTRKQWGADAPSRAFTPLNASKVQGIVLHHGGVMNAPKGVKAVQAFERHHRFVRGWKAVAYNVLVDEEGVAYFGRGLGVQGGATKRWNSRSVSVCYTQWGNGPVPDVALASLAEVFAHIRVLYGQDLWIKGHRQFKSTSCPGDVLFDWLQGGQETVPVATGVVDWAGIAAYVAALGDAVGRKPLRRRSRGAAVEVVQRALRGRGLDPGPVDGIFGGKTRRAVRAFQRASHVLKVDGVVGGRTWHLLINQ